MTSDPKTGLTGLLFQGESAAKSFWNVPHTEVGGGLEGVSVAGACTGVVVTLVFGAAGGVTDSGCSVGEVLPPVPAPPPQPVTINAAANTAKHFRITLRVAGEVAMSVLPKNSSSDLILLGATVAMCYRLEGLKRVVTDRPWSAEKNRKKPTYFQAGLPSSPKLGGL